MKLFAIVLAVSLLPACAKPPEKAVPKSVNEQQKEDQYKKELDEVRKNLKGEVKIKLKWDGKGDFYTWEITGKDAAEVLKANDAISKRLKTGN